FLCPLFRGDRSKLLLRRRTRTPLPSLCQCRKFLRLPAQLYLQIRCCCSCLFLSLICVYQGSGWPRWKNPPLGPSSGSVASCALVFPPSLGSIGAFGPPMSVFTQPGWAEFTLILLSLSS